MKENQHYSFSRKQSDSREWAFRSAFQVCGPEAELFPVQGAACGREAAPNAGAGGSEPEESGGKR